MFRRIARMAFVAFGLAAAAIGGLLLTPAAAASDYACNFVEVQCDRAANMVRVVPFRAENEECDRVRAIKDADWLVDLARHVRGTGKGRTAPGTPKAVRCELGEGKTVQAIVQGMPLNADLQGRCGAVFSATVTIEEHKPHRRRIVNELSLLRDCDSGGAADSIEYFVDSQKLMIQWSSQRQFGPLERTVLARQHLKEAGRNGR